MVMNITKHSTYTKEMNFSAVRGTCTSEHPWRPWRQGYPTVGVTSSLYCIQDVHDPCRPWRQGYPTVGVTSSVYCIQDMHDPWRQGYPTVGVTSSVCCIQDIRWLKVEGPKKIDHNYIHFIAHL